MPASAQSVYEYIARTAEVVEDGVRWRTLGVRGARHYEPAVSRGVAGITFFLTDYWRATGDSDALRLAQGAVRWCSAPERLSRYRGVCAGRTGVGVAYLRHGVSAQDDRSLQLARGVGDWLVAEGPRTVTDFWAGTARKGVFLIRLWEATRDDSYLTRATAHGDWLRANAVGCDMGCRWPVNVSFRGSRTSLGFGHGIAGVGYFLALLTTTTGRRDWSDLVNMTASTLDGCVRWDGGLLNWPTNLADGVAEKC